MDQPEASESGSGTPVAFVNRFPGHALPQVEALAAIAISTMHANGASVTLRAGRNNAQRLVGSTPLAVDLDDLQMLLAEGPGMDAFESRRAVAVDDVATADMSRRWPAFAREATGRGVAAVFSYPLHTGALPFATIDFYRRAAGPLTVVEAAAGADLAGLLARAVLADLVGTDLMTEAALWPANPDWLQIPQATGMASVQLGLSTADALAYLRAAAYSADISLFDVARQVVERTRRFG